MKIIGTTERMCACCEKRTKHLKVIVNMEGKAVIVFRCTEKHGGKTEEPRPDRPSTAFVDDAMNFPQ
jgi:hypothetical protein